MPTFEITAPNGKKYRITGENPQGAMQALQAHLGGGQQPSETPASEASYSGSILPFTKDESGVHFDSNAGLFGDFKRAFTLPHDVMTGEVDPLSNEGIGRAAEMATVVSPASTAARAGERMIPGVANAVKQERVKPPSADALREAAGQGYDEARNMGVDYSAGAVSDLARTAQTALEQDGILPELAPKSFAILRKLQDAPEGSVAPLAGIEAARRAFGNAAKDFNNPTDQLAAHRLRERLDQFLMGGNAPGALAGTATSPEAASAAAKTIRDARGNYAAASRSEKLTGVQDAAELRAAAANSGQNTGNAIRQRIASLLLKPKEAAGYSPEEIGSLERVARGGPAANTTRFVGNLLGGGGGLGMAVTAALGAAPGAVAGSPGMTAAGALLPLAGYGSKQASNALTERALKIADELVRKRSPLHEKMQAAAPKYVVSPEKRAALIRALLLQQEAQQ